MVTAYKDPKLPPQLSLPPDWLAGLTALTKPEGMALLAAVQTLYPHAALPVEVYHRAVLMLDRLSSGVATLRAFCAALDAATQVKFADLAETYRIQVLKSLQDTPGFFFTQRMVVRYLYDDVLVWAAFGYEGASVHLGGYIKRGFDDLDWLPPLPNDL
jgi:hypothetical protein